MIPKSGSCFRKDHAQTRELEAEPQVSDVAFRLVAVCRHRAVLRAVPPELGRKQVGPQSRSLE